MSHVNSLTVTGLAGRRSEYSKRLDRHLNVFFGPNGSGKTSLLRLIDSAMTNDATSVKGVPFGSAQFTIYSINYERVLTRYLDSSSTPQFEPPEASLPGQLGHIWVNAPKQIPWVTSPDEPQFKIDFHHRFLPITRFYPNTQEVSLARMAESTEEALYRQFALVVTALWRNYTARVNAAIAKAQQSGLAKLVQDVLMGAEPKSLTASPGDAQAAYLRVQSFLNRSEGFQHILPSYQGFSQRYATEPRLQILVNEIQEIESSIEQALHPKRSLQGLLQRMFAKTKTVIFTDEEIDIEVGEKIRIGVAGLSSGEKQLIRIFLETLLAEQSTILIDEPEMSMHIDWQRALLKGMQELNPEAQIIVATHSPEIMAEIPDNNILEI